MTNVRMVGDRIFQPDGSRRRVNDFYPTPLGHARAALAFWRDRLWDGRLEIHRALDPGCGSGIWGQALRIELGNQTWLMGCDIRSDLGIKGWYDLVYDRCDFTAAGFRPVGGAFDLVIGNPPFSHAEAFVRKSLTLVRTGGWVAFLLRQNFSGSGARIPLWGAMPYKARANFSNRPSFTNNGRTDASEYSMYFWQRGWQDVPREYWICSESHWRSPEDAPPWVYPTALIGRQGRGATDR